MEFEPDSRQLEGDDASREIDAEIMQQSIDDIRLKDESKFESEAMQWYEEILGNAIEHETDPNSALLSFDVALSEKERIKRLSFKFFVVVQEMLIDRFPYHVSHRLHLAALYKFKLGK